VAGVVPETLDQFPQTNVKICAEVYIPIHHHLLSTAESINDIERVYSGPQPNSSASAGFVPIYRMRRSWR